MAQGRSAGWWIRVALAVTVGSAPFAVACVFRALITDERMTAANLSGDLAVGFAIPMWVLFAAVLYGMARPEPVHEPVRERAQPVLVGRR
jgi:hypothetical protein